MPFNRRPSSSHFSTALAGSLALHVLFLAVTWRQPTPPPADRLIEIDLRDAEKATPKPQPTVAPEPTPAPTPASTAAPVEQPTPQATSEPVPTLPPVAQPVVPTPEPASKPKSTPIPISEPTPLPQPTQPKATTEPTPPARPTAVPRPTIPVDRPRAVPTVAPQPKATVATAPTPEPTEETSRPRLNNARSANRNSRDGNSPRTNLNSRPQPFAGASRAPQPGSGRARNRNATRPDEQAGQQRERFSATSPAGRPRDRFRPERADPFADSDSSRDAGGQSNAPDVSLPNGVRSARRDAGRTDFEAGDRANRAFGRGNPGGSIGSGRPVDASRNGRDGGSARGRNPELADSSGAGGISLPRFPRSGGQSTLSGRRDDVFKIDDPNARESMRLARGPHGPGLGAASGGRDRGAGRNRGAGVGSENDGPARSALRTRPGSGLGASNGDRIGGAPGRGRRGSGELAGTNGFGGNGAGGDGGAGGGRGSNRGSGNGGSGGYRPRVAGVPFGDPFGSGRGNPAGGGGEGGGPGGPGQGRRLARRGSGDGGNGTGDGSDGSGRFPGRGGRGGAGGGGRGFGPGAGNGNTSGDGGRGAGGGNGGDGSGTGGVGRGRRGRGTGGDDEAGGGRGGDGDGARLSRLALERGKLKRGREQGREIGRGIWNPGLVGTFYQDPDRGILEPGHKIDWPTLGAPGSRFVRRHTSKTIDFDWGLDAPLPGLRGTYWSVKWMGRIFVPKTDDYRFFLDDVDDGGRLYLNGKKIIDVWLVQKSSPGSGTMRLEKGAHQITLEYVQGPATASSVRLMWESSSFPRELVGAYIPGDED